MRTALGAGERIAQVIYVLVGVISIGTDLLSDCLRYTKRMQKVTESLQYTSDLYDNHVSMYHSPSSPLSMFMLRNI